MTKETYPGLEEALVRKRSDPKTDTTLLQICQAQWRENQEVTKIDNLVWKLKREKLSHCDKIAFLERQKTKIYIKLGLKYVKPENHNPKEDGA